MLDLESWSDLTGGEDGGSEERGCWKVGEGADGGEKGAVDGKCAGAGVGAEGAVPHDGVVRG